MVSSNEAWKMQDRSLDFSRRRAGSLIAAGACLIGVCYGFARFAYGLFLPAFRQTFDLNAATAGVIASSSYLAYCIGIVAATIAAPRVGAQIVAAAAAALAASGCAIITFAPTTMMLAMGVAVAGTSTGAASPPIAQAISMHLPPTWQSRAQTLTNAGTGVGVLVAGPVALLAQEQWRMAWAGFALACAVVGIWIIIVIPRETTQSTSTQPRSYTRARTPNGTVRMLAASFWLGVASAAGWTFGQDFIQATGGHEEAVTKGAWIALGACGLLGAAAGDAIERSSLRISWRVLMLGFAAVLGIWALLVDSVLVAIAASAAFGALYIALTGVLLVWGTRLYRKRPAVGVGRAFLAIAAGQTVASWTLGLVSDAAGMEAAFIAAAIIAALGALFSPPAEDIA